MKRTGLINRYYKAAEKLLLLLPDQLTGSTEILKRKYQTRFGDRDFRPAIREDKVRILTGYLLITALFLAGAIWGVADQLMERKEIAALQRPTFGKATESFPVQARLKYKDVTMVKEITVKVRQKTLTEQEKQKLLLSFKTRLAQSMLGENEDLGHVSKPLKLMDHDQATGITINWTSSDPELVSEKGDVDLIGATDRQEVMLQAEMTLDDVTEIEVYRLKLDPEAASEDAYRRSMVFRLQEALGQSKADASPVMALPGELPGGIEVKWFTGKKNHTVLLVFAFLFAVTAVYFKRYDRANREIRAAEASLIRDLPEFINKLVLLLNAGLVVSTAFSKLTNDYEAHRPAEMRKNQKERRYLYEELAEIQKRMVQSNTSLMKELTEFSKRSGVREMVRLAAVISDNWNKGSALAEKLEGESGLLWMARKKRAEEKGRLVETKLTLPLMILLIVLIMITIAPSIMEM